MARQCMSSTRRVELWEPLYFLTNTVTSANTGLLDFVLFIVPGTCDFESGLCEYVHDQNSNFEWTNNTGPTYSSNTGPKGDHTTGSGHASAFLSMHRIDQFR